MDASLIALITLIIDGSMLLVQMGNWSMQRTALKMQRIALEMQRITLKIPLLNNRNVKKNEERDAHISADLLKRKLLTFILGLQFLVATIYMICYGYMSHDEIRTVQLSQPPENFIGKRSFSSKIADLDWKINLSTGRKFQPELSVMIWKDHGKYALTKTSEGADIFRNFEYDLDHIIDKNRNENVEIAIEVIGSDDNVIPFREKVYYDGLLGDTLSNVQYYRINEPDIPLYKTFIKEKTVLTNNEFALLKALDAVKYLCDMYDIDEKDIKICVKEFDRFRMEYQELDLKITLKKDDNTKNK